MSKDKSVPTPAVGLICSGCKRPFTPNPDSLSTCCRKPAERTQPLAEPQGEQVEILDSCYAESDEGDPFCGLPKARHCSVTGDAVTSAHIYECLKAVQPGLAHHSFKLQPEPVENNKTRSPNRILADTIINALDEARLLPIPQNKLNEASDIVLGLLPAPSGEGWEAAAAKRIIEQWDDISAALLSADGRALTKLTGVIREAQGQTEPPADAGKRITAEMLLEQLRFIPDLTIEPCCELHILEVLKTALVNARADAGDAHRVAQAIVKHAAEAVSELSAALAEMRSMFPDEQIIISLRDCGEETTTLRGTSREYGIQIGMNGREFDCDTLAETLAAVRTWKGKQEQQ